MVQEYFVIADAFSQLDVYYAPLIAARGAKDPEGISQCPLDKP